MSDKVGAGDILVCVCALKRNMPPKKSAMTAKTKHNSNSNKKHKETEAIKAYG